MSLLAKVEFYLRSLFGKRRLEQQLAEEIRAHVEMTTDANIAQGMTLEEARYAALREFGNVAGIQERTRDERGWVWLEQLGQDLRYAARSLRKNAGFSSVVIVILALGIGANTTIFTALEALLFRPLKATDPDGLVVLSATGTGKPGGNFPYIYLGKFAFTYPFFEQFRTEAKLTDVVAVTGWQMRRPLRVPGTEGAQIESAVVEEVSGNYFPVLGVPTILGRALTEQDDRPGNASAVAVISYKFWQRRFAAAPDVVGKVLSIDNVSLTVVGVIAEGFTGTQVGGRIEVWVPINLSPLLDGNLPWGSGALRSENLPWISILGRLRPGASRAQAALELDQIYQARLAAMDPRRKNPDALREGKLAEYRLELISGATGYAGVRGAYQKPIQVLLVMVGLMQLVACTNVAGLLLARGTSRQREFAVRTALGAGRGRLVRQLLTESLLLAGVAGLIGVLLAKGATRLLGAAVSGLELSADHRVLGFTLLVTIATGVGFGLMPALRLSRGELNAGIQGQGAVRGRWLNSGLVVAQLGFAFVLLTLAGLLVRTLHNLNTVDAGFQREQRLLLDLSLPPGYAAKERFALYRRIADALGVVPGVASVTEFQGIGLLGDTSYELQFSVPGAAADPSRTGRIARVGSRFFETMGIPLVQGRDFGLRDEAARSNGMPAIVISEWSARSLFGDADPLGRRIKLETEYQVVGVAKDLKYESLGEAGRHVFYVPLQHQPNENRITLALQTAVGATALAGPLRTAVAQIDPKIQLSGLRTIEERINGALAKDRLVAKLAGFFGLLAFVFSGVGLFGLLSYTVNRRLKEFGVRMALGASPGHLQFTISQLGIRLGLLGCLVGFLGSLLFTRFVESLLFGVARIDWLTFGGTMLCMICIALAACWLPARRASHVDPIVVLRSE